MFLKKLNGAIALAIAGVMMFTPAINMVNAMEITGDETKNIYSEYIGNDSVDIEILEDNEEVRVANAVTAGTAAGAGLAAIGLTGQALDCALKLERQQKNAYQYYFSV
ncbi:MAG: hypothetical protein ACRCX2_13525 [Paraclostridium sp.]